MFPSSLTRAIDLVEILSVPLMSKYSRVPMRAPSQPEGLNWLSMITGMIFFRC